MTYPEFRPLSAPLLAPWFALHLCLRCRLLNYIVRLPSFSHGFSGFVFWFVKLGGGGLRCVWVTFRGPCALRFSLFAGSEPFRSITQSFALYPAVPVWKIAGVHPWRYVCVTRDFCVTIILSFRSHVVTCGSPGMPCLCV